MSTRMAFCIGMMAGFLLGVFAFIGLYSWSGAYLMARKAVMRPTFTVGETVFYKPLGEEGMVMGIIQPYESYEIALITGKNVTASYYDLEKVRYPPFTPPISPLLSVAPLLILAIGFIVASSTFYLSKRYWKF